MCSYQVKLANGKSVTLGIWDTAGAERFESLSRVYYHSARAAVVCFDVSSLESWHKLKFWVRQGMQGVQTILMLFYVLWAQASGY